MVRRDHPHGDDVVGAGDHGRRRHRNDRIEVASSQRVAEIAEIVGEERLHEGKVGAQRHFEQITRAVDLYHLLAGFDGRSHAGLRQDATKAVTTRTDAFDQRALRDKIALQFAGQHLPLRFRVEADMADDRLAHELRANELADAPPRRRRIVGDHDEVALLLADDLVDDPFGRADGHEAADHQAGAVGDERHRVGQGERSHLASSN